ncbi:MAG: beta strand repeat-containing protein, partial [Acidimicrobiales bacterium]
MVAGPVRRLRIWPRSLMMGRTLAVAVLAVTVLAIGIPTAPSASASTPAATPQVQSPAALTQGGVVTCTGTVTIHGQHEIIPTFLLTLPTGSAGSIGLDPGTPPDLRLPPTATFDDTVSCALSGVIPSGWKVDVSLVPVGLSGAGNAGTLTLSSEHDTFTQQCYATPLTASTFTNQGTLTVGAGANCPAGGFTFEFGTLVNTGTITAPPGYTLNFTTANAGAAASLQNFGSVDVGGGGTVTVHGGTVNDCTKGTVFTQETGATIDNQGSFQIGCGGLVVEGGSIVDGPSPGSIKMFPVPAGLSLNFGQSPSATSSGTIDLVGSGTTLEGTIPREFTVDNPNGNLPVTDGAGNDGTLIIADGNLTDSGTFTNAGTLETTDNLGVSAPKFVNSGTLSGLTGSTVSFTYDNTTTPGIIQNTGTIDLATKTQATIGTENCKSGESLKLNPGSTIENGGSFTVRCGSLTLAGGSVSTAGPLTVQPIGKVSVDFTTAAGTGTGGNADTVAIRGNNATLAGAIPAGWTVSSDVTLNVVAGASNAGHFNLTYGGKIVDAGKFTNSGTLAASVTASAAVTVPTFDNSGTVSALTKSTLQFIYDNPTVPGVIDNTGSFSLATKATVTVGSQSCKSGEKFELAQNSTISNHGTFVLQCGELTVSGGTVGATGPVTVRPLSKVTVDFSGEAIPGASGGADTISVLAAGATLQGAIPTGWTFETDRVVTVAPATSNAGTITLASGGKLAGSGTFTNSGTLDAGAGAAAKVTVPVFDNSGTVSALGGSTLTFSYDNPTTAGVIDNTGTFTLSAGAKLVVGPESCATGETFVQGSGSTISSHGTFFVQCGKLTILGGDVTSAGPVLITPISKVTIHFAAGLPAGSGGAGDTLAIKRTGATLSDTIPAGWTVNDSIGRTITLAKGAENDGTLDAGGFGSMLDAGSFINQGTFVVTSEFSITTITSFSNTGTVTIKGGDLEGRDTPFANTGTVTIAPRGDLEPEGYTQNADGTLNIGVSGTNSGSIYSYGASTLNGTLDLTTTTLPKVGSRFFILRDQTLPRKGTFSKINGAIVNGTVAYTPTYTATNLSLKVVSSAVAESLTASTVVKPPQSGLVPGSTISSKYTVTNTGVSPATGGWEDSIYLGTGTAYAPGDQLLERIPHDTVLAPGASYTNTVSAVIPAVNAGSYHLIAVPDSADLVAGVTFDTQAASPPFPIGAIPVLKPGTSVSTSLAAGQTRYYRVTVPGTSDITVHVTTPGKGDATIYGSFKTVPSPTTSAIASAGGAKTPSVTLSRNTAGSWYIEVRGGDPAGGGVSVTISATVAGLAVTSIYPATAPADGPVTVTLRGSGFSSSFSAALEDTTSTYRVTATSFDVVSSTLAYVTFNLHGAQPVAYTLFVTTGGHQTSVKKGFTVTDASKGGGLKVTIGSPKNLRFGWTGTVSVTFTNTSGSNIAVPIVQFSATNGMIAPAGSTDFQTSITLVDPSLSASRTIPFPTGVLPPGASGTLTFSVLSTSKVTGAKINVGVTDFNSTETAPMDWKTLISGLEPSGFGANTWQQILYDIQGSLGTTEGSFANQVTSLVQTAAVYGITLANESQIIDYAVEEQIAEGYGANASGLLSLKGTGKPLPQTGIELVAASGSGVYTTTSWYNGTFDVWGVPAGKYKLEVPGYLPRAETVSVTTLFIYTTPHTSNGLQVSVSPGATVTGTVTNATTSDPVTGAIVQATDADGTISSQPTGSDGAYTLTGIVPGTVSVTAGGPGVVTSTPATLTVSTAATVTDDFSLSAGGSITGTIHVSGNGAPPPGTTVAASGQGTRVSGFAGTVSPAGTFTISGLPAGTYAVVAGGSGTLIDDQGGIVVSGSGTTGGVSLTLGLGATVHGTVTDATTGDPVVGAAVQSHGLGQSQVASTGAAGTYTLTRVAPGPQTLSVSPPGASELPAAVAIDPAAGATVTQNVALSGWGSITVTALRPTRAALTTASVVLVPTPSLQTRLSIVRNVNKTVNATGVIQFTTLVPGDYTVLVNGTTVSEAVTVTPTHLAASVVLTVPVATVTGTVIDADAAPQAGVFISADDPNGAVETTRTNASGKYTLHLTAAGTFTITASGAGFGPAVQPGVAVSLGTTTTVTFVGGTASLALNVTGPDGPVAGARAELSAGSGTEKAGPATTSTTATGSARFATLVPGTYTLLVLSAGDIPFRKHVAVSTGPTSASITLATGGVLAGTVSDANGPVAGAIIHVVSGTDSATTVSGTGGAYTLTGLAPGTYTASVSAPGDAPLIQSGINITSTQTSTFEPVLSTTGSTVTVTESADGSSGYPALELQVLDATGWPIDQAVVGPGFGGTSSAPTTTVGPLDGGTYTLAVTGPGRGTTTTAFNVPSTTTLQVAPPMSEAPGSDSTSESALVSTSASLGTSEPLTDHQVSADGVADSPSGSGHGSPAPAITKPQTQLTYSNLVNAWFHNAPVPKRTTIDMGTLQNIVTYELSRTIPACTTTDGIASLQTQLRRLNAAKEQAWQAWVQAYTSFHTNGWINFGLIVTDAMKTLVNIASVVTTVMAPEAAKAESLISKIASNSTELKEFTSLFGAFETSMSTLFSTAYTQGATVQNLATLTNLISVLTNFISIASNFVKTAAFGALATIFQNLVQVGQNEKAAFGHLQDIIKGANALIGPVVTAQQTYLRAVQAVLAKAKAISSAFSNLKTKTNCPPKTTPQTKKPKPKGPTTTINSFNGRDPNGITGPSGYGTPQWLAPSKPLDYEVHFQNVPTAKTDVAEVKVVEPLPAGINPTSVSLTGFGFGFGTVHVSLAGHKQSFTKTLPHAAPNGDVVRVTGSFDPSASAITWLFEAVNPKTGDVDSAATAGFLLPDTTAGKGEGYVSFSATMLPGLTTGTTVATQATITFDRNAPLSTSMWKNTIDANVPTAHVAALPATTAAGTLPVSWSGSDGDGSGVATYNVYVSDDGGTLTLWKADTTATSADYPTTKGHTYGFAAQATNHVGTSGPTPTTAQVTTSVESSTPKPRFTSAASATFTAGITGTFSVVVAGTPKPTLAETGILPTGVAFTAASGALSGKPAATTGGEYPITFTATNGVGTGATQHFTLTVDQAPKITSATSTTFTAGSTGSIQVTASGYPAATLAETGTLPTGVAFTAASGALSGKPAATTGGEYSITFTATNGVGTGATQHFTLTVDQAPKITSA